MPIDPDRVQAVFLAAVEIKEPAERAKVLSSQCADNADLRRGGGDAACSALAPDAQIGRGIAEAEHALSGQIRPQPGQALAQQQGRDIGF